MWCAKTLFILSILAHLCSAFSISYGVILEAESNGTSCRIYQWNTRYDGRTFPEVFPEDCTIVWTTPALADPQANVSPNSIGAFLQPLLDAAVATIPVDFRTNTHVYFIAGSSFRLLNANSSSNSSSNTTAMTIMNCAMNYLSDPTKHPFVFNSSWARVLSGEEEGVMRWMSVNIDNTTLANSWPTLGVVGIGSSSVSVAFQLPLPPLYGYYDLRIALNRYTMYTHSYDGYGMDVFFTQFITNLVATSPNATNASVPVKNPCSSPTTQPISMSITLTGKNPAIYQFIGTGNFTQCEMTVLSLLSSNTGANCPVPPCTMNGIYQPLIPPDMPIQIIVSSNVTSTVGCSGPNKMVGCLMQSASTVCSTTLNVTNASTAQLMACFWGTYSYVFLQTIVGLSDNRSIIFGGQSAEASVVAPGVLAYEIALWPVDCSVPLTQQQSIPIEYGAVLDASDYGTKVYLFQWDKTYRNNVTWPTMMNLTSGFGSANSTLALPALYTVDVSNVSSYLQPILGFLQAQVGVALQSSTPVFLIGTGQLVNSNSALLAKVATVLQQSNFLFQNAVGAAPHVLSGEERGVFGWLSCNIQNTFTMTQTIGVIDLESDAFTVTVFPQYSPLAGYFDLRLPYSYRYSLYTHSYANLGLDTVFASSIAKLLASNPNTTVPHPCLPVGYSFNTPRNATSNVNITGAYNVNSCTAMLQTVIGIIVTPSSPNNGLGIAQPVITGMSLQLVTPFIPSSCAANASISCLSPFCPSGSVGRDCFNRAYIFTLLTLGLNLPQVQILSYVQAPSSIQPSVWALGALTYSLGLWDTLPNGCGSSYIPLGIMDDPPLLDPVWFRVGDEVIAPEPSDESVTKAIRTVMALNNTLISVPLGGYRILSTTSAANPHSDVMVKLSAHFYDCFGTAPGSPPEGRRVDAIKLIGQLGPVSLVGSYHICFKHRLDWEQSGVAITVQSPNAERNDTLFYGYSTCWSVLTTTHTSYCGCYYEVDQQANQLIFSLDLDVPSFTIQRSQQSQVANQGCCTYSTPVRERNRIDEQTYWGLCK
jgi:hypothetical protein